MKARVKDTGEIVDVRYDYMDKVWLVKGPKYPIRYHERELDFIEDNGIDWDYWRRMYAGMAMQGLMGDWKFKESINDVFSDMNKLYEITSKIALDAADALIAELKKDKGQ